MSNGLSIPPIPKVNGKVDEEEFRIKIWTEIHLLSKCVPRVEILERDVQTAKIWGKVSTTFLAIMSILAGLIAKIKGLI